MFIVDMINTSDIIMNILTWYEQCQHNACCYVVVEVLMSGFVFVGHCGKECKVR